MAYCGKIQTAVRRDEKKLLNPAYKLIKYKFEGPQSKIRIQTPQEKAFVMLQSAVSGHYFSDFTLRQQLAHVVDNSSQILSACEQYAKEGSGHGYGMIFVGASFYTLWTHFPIVLRQTSGDSVYGSPSITLF